MLGIRTEEPPRLSNVLGRAELGTYFNYEELVTKRSSTIIPTLKDTPHKISNVPTKSISPLLRQNIRQDIDIHPLFPSFNQDDSIISQNNENKNECAVYSLLKNTNFPSNQILQNPLYGWTKINNGLNSSIIIELFFFK